MTYEQPFGNPMVETVHLQLPNGGNNEKFKFFNLLILFILTRIQKPYVL